MRHVFRGARIVPRNGRGGPSGTGEHRPPTRGSIGALDQSNDYEVRGSSSAIFGLSHGNCVRESLPPSPSHRPSPRGPGVDATVKAEGTAPFCRARAEVRRPLASTFPRHGRYSWVNHISSVCFVFAEPLADLRHAHRYRRVLVSVERTIFKGIWAKRFD